MMTEFSDNIRGVLVVRLNILFGRIGFLVETRAEWEEY